MIQIDYQERPPHSDDHTACSTPNPPWWCNDTTPDANIDMGIGFLIVVGLIIGVITIYIKCQSIRLVHFAQTFKLKY